MTADCWVNVGLSDFVETSLAAYIDFKSAASAIPPQGSMRDSSIRPLVQIRLRDRVRPLLAELLRGAGIDLRYSWFGMPKKILKCRTRELHVLALWLQRFVSNRADSPTGFIIGVIQLVEFRE